MFPVYLPKRQQDMRDDDYDTNITLNENYLNQNLKILHEQASSQQATIQAQADTIAELRETIKNLQRR